MEMDEMYAVLGIGLCIFVFLVILLGLGSFYGGDWELVAQGVTKFILIITGFSFAVYVLVKLMGRR